MLSMPRRACCLAGRKMQAGHVDDGEQGAEAGEVDVGGVRVGQDGLARDQDGEQEQHRQEGVAAEDVTEGQLVVALPDRVSPVLSSGSEVAAARTVAPNSTPDRPTWSAAAVPLSSARAPATRVATAATPKTSTARVVLTPAPRRLGVLGSSASARAAWAGCRGPRRCRVHGSCLPGPLGQQQPDDPDHGDEDDVGGEPERRPGPWAAGCP